MNLKESQENEFIIPTRYKIEIGSYLSWPIGAKELTKAFLHVPQIKELQIRFWESYPKYPKGKWPASFPVIEAQFSHSRRLLSSVPNLDWEFCVHPVPRNLRAKIREVLMASGFQAIAKWLLENQMFSGSPSYLRFRGIWNSDSEELNFTSHDKILPETSATNKRQK